LVGILTRATYSPAVSRPTCNTPIMDKPMIR
jgi:hypothetical protein